MRLKVPSEIEHKLMPIKEAYKLGHTNHPIALGFCVPNLVDGVKFFVFVEKIRFLLIWMFICCIQGILLYTFWNLKIYLLFL